MTGPTTDIQIHEAEFRAQSDGLSEPPEILPDESLVMVIVPSSMNSKAREFPPDQFVKGGV